MSDKEDHEDVLSVSVSSEGEFSGFSSVTSPPGTPELCSKSDKKKKGKENKENKKKKSKKDDKSRRKNKGKDKKESSAKSSDNPLSNLSAADIENLRGLLGIQPNYQEYEAFDANEQSEWNSSKRLPLRVEINSADISDDEFEDHRNIEQGFRNALEEEEEEEGEWSLPKMENREKGKAINPSLAKMVNTACTSSCDIQSVLDANKVPENCDKAFSPLVNPEVWRVMDRKARSQDRILSSIQSMVAGAIAPIVRLAELLKPQIATNSSAKALISDALTCLGQAQYKLSLRRRYAIRPSLNFKYSALCSMNTPVTSYLFGDDIGKEIKACDSYSYIGKSQSFRAHAPRGRGFVRQPRRQFSYGAPGYGQGMSGYGNDGYGHRYQPYPSRGQPQMRGNLRGYQIPKKTAPTATVTAPNGK